MNSKNMNYKKGDRVERIGTGATGTIDDVNTYEGQLTYIVKYDETQRRHSDGFEYLTEEVFENEIEPASFFTAGVKYRCTRDVVSMKGRTTFKAGNVYEQTNEPTYFVGWLRNEQGERHTWPQPVYIADEVKTWGYKPEDIDPRNYFEPVAA